MTCLAVCVFIPVWICRWASRDSSVWNWAPHWSQTMAFSPAAQEETRAWRLITHSHTFGKAVRKIHTFHLESVNTEFFSNLIFHLNVSITGIVCTNVSWFKVDMKTVCIYNTLSRVPILQKNTTFKDKQWTRRRSLDLRTFRQLQQHQRSEHRQPINQWAYCPYIEIGIHVGWQVTRSVSTEMVYPP